MLWVAEKGSVARSISGILSHGSATKVGGVRFAEVHFFRRIIPNVGYRDIYVTNVSGHITQQEFRGNEHKDWFAVPFAALMDESLTTVHDILAPSNEHLVNNLRTYARKCQYLVLWLDCDDEGEYISFEVEQICLQVNPNMTVKRARFAALITQELEAALANLSVLNRTVVKAVEMRRNLDIRSGFAFTRHLSTLLRTSLGDGDTKVISWGTCQIPTLGFVVRRYLDKKHFTPESFWFIEVEVEYEGVRSVFKWRRNRLFDRLACVILYQEMMRVEPVVATVIKYRAKTARKYRPFPLNTVNMQKLAASKLQMSSSRSMEVAEALYMKGYISYPRTETDSFSDAFTHLDKLNGHVASPKWGEYVKRLLEEGIQQPRKGKNNDEAHPPIYPVRYTYDFTSREEEKLYELITRHYIACCSYDAVGDATEVELKIGEEVFHGDGLVIRKRNYLDVYPYETWKGKVYPPLSLHQVITPTSIMLKDGITTAPELLTEADLIRLMDQHGIGTDATIAQHISTILQRQYVEKKPSGHFSPLAYGLALIQSYIDIGIRVDLPDLRALVEYTHHCVIQEGMNPQQALSDTLFMYRKILGRIREVEQHIKANFIKALSELPTSSSSPPPGNTAPPKRPLDPTEAPTQPRAPIPGHRKVGLCPSCKKGMLLRYNKAKSSHFMACEDYSCRTFISLPKCKEAETVEATCKTCEREKKTVLHRVKFKGLVSPPGTNPRQCTTCFGKHSKFGLEILLSGGNNRERAQAFMNTKP